MTSVNFASVSVNRVNVFVAAFCLVLLVPGTLFCQERGPRVQIAREVRANVAAAVAAPFRVLIDCWPTTSGPKSDRDNDGIVDRCEQTLAEKFAPIVYHSAGERNYPTNVDVFLQ